MNNRKISDYTIKELRQMCQKTAPNPARESKVGKFSRVFSIYFTKILLCTRLTPNKITIISVFIFFIGIFLFFVGNYYLNIVGSLIVFLSIVIDGCDGEVARFRKMQGGWGGSYVEPVSHDIQYGFAFLFLGAFIVYQGHPSYYLVLAGLASLTKLLYRLLETRFWMKCISDLSEEKIENIKVGYKKKAVYIRFFYWTNKNFFSSTGIFLVLFIFSIINRVELYIWFFAVGYTLLWLALFVKQVYKINNQYL